MRAAWAIGGVVAVGIMGGCVLVTGGANGYTAADGGSSSSGGGSACSTPKDCNGQACCYPEDAGFPPAPTCQASCPASQQSCGVGGDCGEGGACLAQSCTIDGITVQVTTCGAISFCTQ
jgi:hypothetical protein